MLNSWTESVEADVARLRAAALSASLREQGVSISSEQAQKYVRVYVSLEDAYLAAIRAEKRTFFAMLPWRLRGWGAPER